MKKVLAVLAVVLVVCAAGAAFAQQQNGRQRLEQRGMSQDGEHKFFGRGPAGMPPAPFEGRGFGPKEFCGNHRGHKGRLNFAQDMPEEIRAKVVEAAKLHIDLEAALSEKPIDKAKATEIFSKIQKAEQEIEAWKFGKKIERIEAFRTQKELNSKIPPAQKAEAPAPEAKAE